MAKLCFDYGHGGGDSGAIYIGRKESDDVLSVGRGVAEILRRHGVIIAETRTVDMTLSLDARCDFENNDHYDYFVSFHRNAFKPETATGVETYTYINPGVKLKGMAEQIQRSLVEVGFANRGVKTANFYVLRKTKAPAVLIEIGFIDNSQDNSLFDSKRAEIITGISKAILSQLGLHYIEETQTPSNTITEALDLLIKKGILKSPEYWMENARAGSSVKGEYAGLLIENMAGFISREDRS